MKAWIALLAATVALHLPPIFAADPPLDEQLQRAVQTLDAQAVKRLLARGANANQVISGRSLLGWAAVYGDAASIRWLLGAGAKDGRDAGGYTALMLAVSQQQGEAVRALLEGKPDLKVRDQSGRTLAMLAVESGKPDIVEALLAAGADFNAARDDGTTPAVLAAMGMGGDDTKHEILRMMGAKKVHLDRSNAAFTALFYAVEQRDEALVETLLAAGAKPTAATAGGRLPVVEAVSEPAILKRLLAAGASPDTIDRQGDPVLFTALRERQREALEVLLTAGADANKPDRGGRSPLAYAKDMFLDEEVVLLQRHGARDPSAAPPPPVQAAAKPAAPRPPRNEYDAIPKIQPVQEMHTGGAEVVYYSAASVKEILAFYRKTLPAAGWKLSEVNTDEANYATLATTRGAARMTVALGLDSSAKPPRVSVSLTPHGALSVPSLPRYPGSTAMFEQDAMAIYVSADAMPKVADETMKLLQAAGWSGRLTAQTAQMRHLTFEQGGSELTVQVSIAPAQGNRTTIQYSLRAR